MSQAPYTTYPQPQPGEKLGVIAAMGMGWRLLKSDFWPLWTAALAMFGLMLAASCVPLGPIIALPPLMAGLMYVLMRRIDGGEVVIGGIFEGFKERFTESIMSMLPVLIVMLVGYVVQTVASFATMIPAMMMDSQGEAGLRAVLVAEVGFLGLCLVIALVTSLVQALFAFAPIAVWQTPKAGWEAAKISVRLVFANLGSMVALVVLAWLIGSVAGLVGCAACIVGLLFVTPAVAVWYYATLIFLYRSWTGQPLVQPLPPASPEAPAAPGV